MRRFGWILLILVLTVSGGWGIRSLVIHRPLREDQIASAKFVVSHVGFPGTPGYWLTVTPDGLVELEESRDGKRDESRTRTKLLTPSELAHFRTTLEQHATLVGEYDSGSTKHDHLYLDLIQSDGTTSTISLQHGARPHKVSLYMQEINKILGPDWAIDR